MRTMTELRKQALDLGIKAPEKVSKKELETRLAEALQSDSTLPQIEVMLAQDFKDVTPQEQQAILHDPNWVGEEKLNGVRMKLHITPTGIRIDGRRKSDKTYQYVERTENFPHIKNCAALSKYVGMVLDAELLMLNSSIDTGSVITAGTMTSTTAVTNCAPNKAHQIQAKHGRAQLFVFDLIRGTDGKPATYDFRSRRHILLKLWMLHGEELRQAGINLVDQTLSKELLCQKVLAAGGEGIMLKDIRAIYAEGKRAKTILKWKKIYTNDGFVSGYVPAEEGKGWEGLVGALEISAYDAQTGEARVIGSVQPGTLQFRRQISNSDGTLKQEYYGRVVEIRGNDWTKNFRLFHCVLLCWRPDKNKEDCRVDFSAIVPGKDERSE